MINLRIFNGQQKMLPSFVKKLARYRANNSFKQNIEPCFCLHLGCLHLIKKCLLRILPFTWKIVVNYYKSLGIP